MGKPVQKSFIVEFLGIPGVGKTTLLNKAMLFFEEEGQEVSIHNVGANYGLERKIERINRTRIYLTFILRHPIFVLRGIATISLLRHESFADWQKGVVTWIKRIGRYELYHRQPGIHMVDSGILQSLWTIGFTTKNKHFETSCHSLLDGNHRPDVVICVEAPLHIVYARLMQRPGKNSRLEKKLDPQALKKARFVLQQIKAHLGTVNSDDRVKLYTIDNSQEGEGSKNAKRIVDFIISECRPL